MELKYVVMTIIKILISVPTVLLIHSVQEIHGAALMGGHLDNKSNSTNNATTSETYLADYELYDSQELSNNTEPSSSGKNSEEIPNPSPLVLPGYNLPENIFNKGKPFYLEKDPLTGKIDFNSKSSLDDELYDYVADEPSEDIYDKANIDRKDGPLSSHRPSDVNQLTPNFHDFLNLPVKYNSDKYVYPLISSSYANTKIQGNVNKQTYNHKNYNVKTSTYKPTASPTYYSSSSNSQYFNPDVTTKRTTTSTTTKPTTTTTKPSSEIYLTTKPTNLLSNNNMGHPSFSEEFEEDYSSEVSTQRKPTGEIYLTTGNVNNIYLTTKAPGTTTKRGMSLFEQLFGEYDETVTTTERTKPPSLFQNLPANKNVKNKYDGEVKTEKPSYTTPVYSVHHPNSHAGPNVATGSNMEHSYEYDEEYPEDNIAVENSPTVNVVLKNITNPQLNNKTEPEDEEVTSTVSRGTTTLPSTTVKVTSLPLGENHVTGLNNRQPIIVATQNLKEKLSSEKVAPKLPVVQNAPSTSNVHIAPDQDTVSFVVGNHQNVDGGQYVGTALKESPYDSNPFRPLYGQQATYAGANNINSNKDSVSYTIQANAEAYSPPVVPAKFPEASGSAVTIQPLRNSEASLAIGVPVGVKQKPGQVVDEKLEINEQIEFPKGNGPKIVFPDEKESESAGSLVPPPPPPNREVLQLSSQPMYHQLPSDLTPPKEQEVVPAPTRVERPRPPWDPRPGHFYSGKPEYNRPPRPPPDIAYKRIDNLPNILPQFRPNMKHNNNPPPHYFDNRLVRQPLLERPSNRPIGFFEKLQPPPPPSAQSFHNLRKIPPPPPQALDEVHHQPIAEDRIINEGPQKLVADQFGFFQTPPKVVVANRRHGDDDTEVETLQMIQAKNSEKKADVVAQILPGVNSNDKIGKDGTDKPLYVVYPVNTPPIKLDVIETNKKESVVIGTRAELPLPPSKIKQDFYEQNPILHRNDAPVLKPHPRPPTFPIKSDFPYPLERPDPSVIHPAVPETPSNNNLDEPTGNSKYGDEFISSNQWNTIGENIESRIVSAGSKINAQNNVISATLKTYTEKPIAVAYTPTEPPTHHHLDYSDKFSMPNYATPVIPEIRPGTVDNADLHPGGSNSEFTVSAVMHTQPQRVQIQNKQDFVKPLDIIKPVNHKPDGLDSVPPTQLDFQAPFQASVSIDSMNQGWSVVRDKNKTTTEDVVEVTTIPIATTSEFDIENFKPHLIGGFKPIYTYPDDERKTAAEVEVNEREEK